MNKKWENCNEFNFDDRNEPSQLGLPQLTENFAHFFYCNSHLCMRKWERRSLVLMIRSNHNFSIIFWS